MPDILIRGMEMPQTCEDCDFCELIQCELWCTQCQDTANHFSRLKDRPLVELPEHGDLIDRDAFREENKYYLNREFINPKYEDTLDDLLKDAPVVIPANKEENK